MLLLAKILVFLMVGFFLAGAISLAIVLFGFIKNEYNMPLAKRAAVTFFPVLVFFPAFHVEKNKKEVYRRIIFSIICFFLAGITYLGLEYIKTI